MVNNADIYKYFRSIDMSTRLELMCALFKSCLPVELRFFGTCIEELASKDYANLKEFENKSNSPKEVSVLGDCFDDKTRGSMISYLCLLYSSNKKCSIVFFSALDKMVHQVRCNPQVNGEVLEDLLLLLTIAIHHPAFSFHHKQILMSHLVWLRNYLRNTCSKIGEPIQVKKSFSGHIKSVSVKKCNKKSDDEIVFFFEVTWKDKAKTCVTKSLEEIVNLQDQLVQNQSTELHGSTKMVPMLGLKSLRCRQDGHLEWVKNDVESFMGRVFEMPESAFRSEQLHRFFCTSSPQLSIYDAQFRGNLRTPRDEIHSKDKSIATHNCEDHSHTPLSCHFMAAGSSPARVKGQPSEVRGRPLGVMHSSSQPPHYNDFQAFPPPGVISDLDKWLKDIRLDKYSSALGHLTFDELRTKTIGDFQELGLVEGASKRIVQEIEKVSINGYGGIPSERLSPILTRQLSNGPHQLALSPQQTVQSPRLISPRAAAHSQGSHTSPRKGSSSKRLAGSSDSSGSDSPPGGTGVVGRRQTGTSPSKATFKVSSELSGQLSTESVIPHQSVSVMPQPHQAVTVTPHQVVSVTPHQGVSDSTISQPPPPRIPGPAQAESSIGPLLPLQGLTGLHSPTGSNHSPTGPKHSPTGPNYSSTGLKHQELQSDSSRSADTLIQRNMMFSSIPSTAESGSPSKNLASLALSPRGANSSHISSISLPSNANILPSGSNSLPPDTNILPSNTNILPANTNILPANTNSNNHHYPHQPPSTVNFTSGPMLKASLLGQTQGLPLASTGLTSAPSEGDGSQSQDMLIVPTEGQSIQPVQSPQLIEGDRATSALQHHLVSMVASELAHSKGRVISPPPDLFTGPQGLPMGGRGPPRRAISLTREAKGSVEPPPRLGSLGPNSGIDSGSFKSLVGQPLRTNGLEGGTDGGLRHSMLFQGGNDPQCSQCVDVNPPYYVVTAAGAYYQPMFQPPMGPGQGGPLISPGVVPPSSGFDRRNRHVSLNGGMPPQNHPPPDFFYGSHTYMPPMYPGQYHQHQGHPAPFYHGNVPHMSSYQKRGLFECYNCGQVGHKAANCQEPPPTEQNQYRLSYEPKSEPDPSQVKVMSRDVVSPK